MDRHSVYLPPCNNIHEIEIWRGRISHHIFPKLIHVEGSGNKFQAVEMVRMWMSKDEIVEGCDLFSPEHWGYHVSSHIEAVVIKPTSIDQHPLPLGKFDQNAVPLSHVDKGDSQPPSQMGLDIPVGYVPCNNDEQEDRYGQKSFYPVYVGQIEDEKIEQSNLKRGGCDYVVGGMGY